MKPGAHIDIDIAFHPYGNPMSIEKSKWWKSQDDLLVSLVSSESVSNGLGLKRLSHMVADNPALVRKPLQARSALIGLLIAHGRAPGDAIGYEAQKINNPPPEGLRELALLLLPQAMECTDTDFPDPPPSDLVSACLIANDPQTLERVLFADPPPRTINGLPWMHHAAMTGKAQCLKVLIDKGFDVQARDASGNTALHKASTPEVVKALMAAGLNPALSNDAGHMPAQAWAARTSDRAKQEAMLSVLMSSPASNPDPVESFFVLAQSSNMGRLKSFAKKLGVDFGIRHQGQGLAFAAALRLAREAMRLNEIAPTIPQDTRVASNWLGYLVQDWNATAATTLIERQGIVALADALHPDVRPIINFGPTRPPVPGHLRHIALSLAESTPPTKFNTTPSTQIRLQIQKIFVDAIEQALDADDGNSVSDAVHLATFAFSTAASDYLHKTIAPMLSSRLTIPAEHCDTLMLASCQSFHEFIRNSNFKDMTGVAFLQQMISSVNAPLPKTADYIRQWSRSVSMSTKERLALEPLLAFALAHEMASSTPSPSTPSRSTPRF